MTISFDVLRTAWIGVGGRPQRTVLAALGIALGIAALVALTGAAASNRAQLLADLDELGANLAVVRPGSGPNGDPVPLPDTAPNAILRQDHVDRIGVFETPPDGLTAFRSDLVPEAETNGLAIAVARPDVLDAIDGTLRTGRWFDDASRGLPVAVLGSTAAERLGIAQAGDRIVVGGSWYGVLGVLEPAGLATEVDTAVILGDRWVRDRFAGETIGDIAAVYVRAAPGTVDSVAAVLGRAAAPESPFVSVSKLSDLADARATADDALASLGLALAGIALLVGGVGIANSMVVTVLERRGEIGLRRALGARPGQIAAQFITESALLALLGGVGGVVIGAAGAAVLAVVAAQPILLPFTAIVWSPPAAAVIGALAGVQPALRAARLPPTEALRGS